MRIEQKTKKIQIKHQLKNEEGETLRQPVEIKKEYAKYYKALLKTKQAITSEEQQAKIKVEKQFTEIMKEEINKKRERITENMVKKKINKMKRKKARDCWKAECIKQGGEGGEEMAESLAVLFNRAVAVDNYKISEEEREPR